MNDYPFTGTVSALFTCLDEGNTKEVSHLKILKDYGDTASDDAGNEIVLHQWESGGRKLGEYEKDGSLFLIQTSIITEDDDFRMDRDWFQVDSEKHAEKLNKTLNGYDLVHQYRGPHIWSNDEGLTWKAE